MACPHLRSGADKAHKKLNDGAVNLGVQWLVQIVADNDGRVAAAEGAGGVALDRETMVRSDPEYLEWYRLYGKAYEMSSGRKMPIPQQQLEEEPQRQGRQQPRGRAAQPRALPPPSSTSYSAALQPQQRQRQAVPASRTVQVPPAQQRPMPQKAWGSGSRGVLLDVQRRPAAPPIQQQLQQQQQQQQQQQVAPGPALAAPRPAAPAPPPQQQVPPAQQRQQQQVMPPPGRSFNQAVRREVVQPDAIITNY